MIVPDPANGTILSYVLTGPGNTLTQISYDFGTPSTRPGALGSTPNIQHVEVADPTPGTWTANILWANGRSHLQSPPNVPGSYTGNVSFLVAGQNYVTTPATGGVKIPGHSSVTVPLSIAMPSTPGDHPESVQFAENNGHAFTSLPVARRTLIPSAGGQFDTTITSTVGRGVGQISTYDIDVPAGEQDIDVSFSTPDASADNRLTYWLLNPGTTLAAGTSYPASLTVTNTANVGRTFTVRSTAGDLAGITPVYIPSGGTGTVAFGITPNAPSGTVVAGTLTVTSNTSVANQTDTFASLPYTYTAG